MPASKQQQQPYVPTSTDPESIMDQASVAAFLDRRSTMSVVRLRKHPNPDLRLPPPDCHIGQTPYWRRKVILDYRDRLFALPPPPPRVTKLPPRKARASSPRAQAATPEKPAKPGHPAPAAPAPAGRATKDPTPATVRR